MSSVPAERLAQIAARKLNALKVPSRVLPDGGTVEGVFTFTPGRLVNPISAVPLGRSRFKVVGHDRLQFLDAPLASLEPVAFYDANSPSDVENALASALVRRGEQLKLAAARFEKMRLTPMLDPDELTVRVRIDAPGIGFELESDPAGTWVRRVVEGGKEYLLDRSRTGLNLDEFSLGVDLELYLSELLPQLKAAQQGGATPPGAQGAAARVVLEEVPAGPGMATLGEVFRAFGAGATLVPGERVQVRQVFSAGAVHYQFVAVHDAGMTFKAQLVGPRGIVWQDRIDIQRFPGTRSFVASTLGVPLPEAVAEASRQQRPAAGASAAAPVQTQAEEASASAVPIQPGEVWLMAVLIEQETPTEVRYVCTDPEGRPYGAARVLGRADFARVFAPHRGGWRLRIRIEAVQGAQVVYRQLDAAGNLAPQPKALNIQVLQSTFIPEAADY